MTYQQIKKEQISMTGETEAGKSIESYSFSIKIH